MDDAIKATGIKRKFRVSVTRDYDIALDEALTPNAEWRSYYYPLFSLQDMAEFIAAHGSDAIERRPISGLLGGSIFLFDIKEVNEDVWSEEVT